MGYSIDWRDRGVEVKFEQSVNQGDLIKVDSLLYNNPRYDNCRFAIWDLREVEQFQVDSREVLYSAATDNATASFSKLSKVILIAKRSDIIERFEEYVAHMRHMGNTWDFRVFDDANHAYQWVKESSASQQ